MWYKNGVINGLIALLRSRLSKWGATNFLVMWSYWHYHQITTMALDLAYDTYASNSTNNDTKSPVLTIHNMTNAAVSLILSAPCERKHVNDMYVPNLSHTCTLRHLYQYICLIWTQCNQQCDQEHSYTYITYYWHMPLNKYASHITHSCPTALLLYTTYRHHITTYTSQNLQQTATFFYHAITIHVPTANMPLKCHICATYANYFMGTYETTVSLYIPDMNSVTKSNAIILHYWYMPLNNYTCYIAHICPTVLLL